MWVVALISVLLSLQNVPHGSFTNPLFPGGDPWVTFDSGTYYYSASNCDDARDICVKAARTVRDLISAPWTVVWTAGSESNSNGTDIWAPEIHKLGGHWYIYYAADPARNNDLHRLFVLRAATDNPLGPYVEPDTGASHGELAGADGRWGIDPDVFSGHDGALYLTWSCTNYPDSRFPQSICLARMHDPLHLASTPVQISEPTEPWESRGRAIQEGPVGYVRNGRTFITYSGGSSWIPNDYAVGLLSNSGNLLDPAKWRKTGPIFDHHGTTFGPGSVVFVQGAERDHFWNLYHAIDNLDCNPAYRCRDIRMQPMFFDSDGTPELGYPYNPNVSVDPSPPHLWGPSWGDAAEGLPAGQVNGNWGESYRDVELRTVGEGWSEIFREQNPNRESFRASAQVRMTRQTGRDPAFGIYCLYDDEKNHAELLIDARDHSAWTSATVKGQSQETERWALASGFRLQKFHHLGCEKQGPHFTFWIDGGQVHRDFDLVSGQMGVLARGALVSYREAGIEDTSLASSPAPAIR